MSKFKDSMNRWITSGLFKETAQTPNNIVYTLEGCKKLYIAANDLTGYLFSEEHLGGYQHWLALKESPALQPHILAWEEELEVKIRAEALQSIYKESKSEKGYQASKYLVEGGWKTKTPGRPTKAKIKKESDIRSRMYDEFKPKMVK